MKKYGIWSIYKKLQLKMIKNVPVLTLFYIVTSMAHGIFWGVETMMQQRFFDEAARLTMSQTKVQTVFVALLMLGFTDVTCQVLNGVGNYIPTVLAKKVEGIWSGELFQKMSRLSAVDFEDTKRLDDINKARKGLGSARGVVFVINMIFLFYIPYFLFMGWYLFSLKPMLVWALLFVFVPTALTQLLRSRVFARVEDQSAPLRRENEYYENCITSREYFKETRLLGGFYFFKELYARTLDQAQRLRYKAELKTNLAELAMSLLTIAGYFGIILMLFQALMRQEITVGAFAAVFNSIGFLYSIMQEVICMHIGGLAKELGTVQNYMRFMDLDEWSGKQEEVPQWGDIVLENVSFTYPGADKAALENVSLTLKKGETLAVVGENGSGKSTLIRLLSGMYAPASGRVLHNGTDVSELSMRALFQNTSAVFQKYQRYQMTLSDNLRISQPGKNADEGELSRIMEMAGLDTEGRSFADGYDTMLSREFGGTDLSGGQWQRVAIARGFFRDHNLIILDEPTAAIDPYEETRIYNRFAQMAKDKSALIVTHRLGSVKLADRIVVMKEGRAVQVGSHEELIRQDGEYKRLYEAQEQWYE